MKASHNLERVSVSFDDDTLLANGGLSVAALLAEKLGVADLVDEHVTIGGEAGANSGAKAATVIGAALAGRRLHRRCPRAAGGRDPAAQARASSSRVTRSSWRTVAQMNARRIERVSVWFETGRAVDIAGHDAG